MSQCSAETGGKDLGVGQWCGGGQDPRPGERLDLGRAAVGEVVGGVDHDQSVGPGERGVVCKRAFGLVGPGLDRVRVKRIGQRLRPEIRKTGGKAISAVQGMELSDPELARVVKAPRLPIIQMPDDMFVL